MIDEVRDENTDDETKTKEDRSLPVAPLERHPAITPDIGDEYVKQFEKEFRLAKELDMEFQSKLTQAEIIRKDVDKLAESKGYYQVNESLINKMLQYWTMKAKCVLYNITQYVFGTMRQSIHAIVWLILFGVSLYVSIEVGTGNRTLPVILGIVGGGASAIFIFINVSAYIKRGFSYSFMKVNIQQQRVKDAEIKIPYGAMKKLKEAMDTNIFTHFVVSHPVISVDDSNTRVLANNTDPALCGESVDRRRFLICWWDMKRDEDKVPKKLDWIKNYKIEA